MDVRAGLHRRRDRRKGLSPEPARSGPAHDLPRPRDVPLAGSDREFNAAALGHVAPPSPEEVFLAWLLWLPDDADIRSAAAAEIARIEARGHPTLGSLRLREILREVAAAAAPRADQVQLTTRKGELP